MAEKVGGEGMKAIMMKSERKKVCRDLGFLGIVYEGTMASGSAG